MEKLASVKQFGKITVKNYDYRPQMSEEVQDYIPFLGRMVCIKRKHYFKGWGERSYLYVDNVLKGCGSYTRINRPRQCFDFQMSTMEAMKNAMKELSRSEYEQFRKDFNQVKEYVKD